MASKYDTNPLDPDFPKKAGHSQQTEFLPNLDAETRAFTATIEKGATTGKGARTAAAHAADEPTRRYDNPNFAQYSSVYAEQQAGPMYQTTRLAEPEKPSSRKIVGLPENLLMIAPYTPFSIGLIAGILELLFVPQSETKVRFHAAQGLAAHIGILLVYAVLGVIGEVTNVGKIGSFAFGLATTIFLVVTMMRVWKGKAAHFEMLDGLTNWLNDKIKTQPKQ